MAPGDEVRASHLVSVAAAEALAGGDVEGFLRLRASDLATLSRAFLTVRLAPSATIRPPIRELLERGADEGSAA
jgi:hypothetical protein